VKTEGFSFPASSSFARGGRMDHRIRNRTTAHITAGVATAMAGAWSRTRSSRNRFLRPIRDPHRHSMSRQVFTILSGTAAMILDGERVALTAGDSLTVPAGALHQFLNDGEVAVASW